MTLVEDRIAKDVRGGEVDRVLVSEGTRRMADGSTSNKAAPRWEVEREEVRIRLLEVQCRLGTIGTQVRGQRLPPSEYQALQREQASLKQEQQTLFKRNMELKKFAVEKSTSISTNTGYEGLPKIELMNLMVAGLKQLNDSMQELIQVVKAKGM